LKILLASPILTSEFDSGIYILRALSELGHHVNIWDYRLEPDKKIDTDYDLFLANKGESIDPDKFKSPKVCWYPDVIGRFPEHIKVLKKFDRVFTINKPPEGYGFTWLAGCYEPLIHRDFGLSKTCPTIYVGTCNSQRKLDYIKEINPSTICGNEWHRFGIKAYPPQYSLAFTNAVNRAKVAINVHESEHGTNRKLFELIPCAFTLTDRVEGIDDIFGKLANKISFETPAEAKELITYYLENEDERNEVWEAEKEMTKNFTYANQVRRILEEAL